MIVTINSNLNITLDELRILVFEVFKNSSENQYEVISREVKDLIIRKGLIKDSDINFEYYGCNQLSLYDKKRIRDIIWDLIIEKVITIGMDMSYNNWPFLKLTEYGKKVVAEGYPTLHDQN